MKPEYKKCIEKNVYYLCRDMNPALVLSRLMKNSKAKGQGMFKQYDFEQVQHEVTTQDKNMYIIDALKNFTHLSEFLSILASIDSTHYQLAKEIQPVYNRIAWFVPSPTHAAAVVYTLEKYAGVKFSKMARCGEDKSLVLRRGRVFPEELEEDMKSPIGDEIVDKEKMALQSHRTEVSLVFPTAGSDTTIALEKWFRAGLTNNADLILMGGVSCGGAMGMKVAIATRECGGVAGEDKVCAGLSDDRMSSLESCLSQVVAERTEQWVQDEASTSGLQPEVRFVSTPEGESHDPSSSLLVKFYELCKCNCPNQSSLLCHTPDVRTAIGPESTAAIACSCILMEVCKFYHMSVFKKD